MEAFEPMRVKSGHIKYGVNLLRLGDLHNIKYNIHNDINKVFINTFVLNLMNANYTFHSCII